MEIIHKTINLEDFKNRFPKSFNTKWGEVVSHDYIVNRNISSGDALYEMRDKFPLSYDEPFSSSVTEDHRTRFRYGNMVLFNAWLEDVIDKSTFFKLCKRNGEYIWVEYNDTDDFNDSNEPILIDILTELPLAEDYEGYVGRIMWISDDADTIKITFHDVGNESGYDDVFTNIQYFSEFFDDAREGNPQMIETGGTYVDITIPLTQSCNDFGKYTESGESEYVVEEGSETTILTESRLSGLKRFKKYYDDNGNELPFAVSTSSGNCLGDISGGTEDLYAVPEFITGVSYNVYVNDEGVVCGDYISAITIADTTVKFKYVIEAEILTGNSYSGGIVYTEEYMLGERERFEFMYEDSGLTAMCKTILYEEQPEEYRNFDGYDEEKQYAKATFIPEFMTEVSSASSVYFKEESLVGITDIRRDDSKPRVERGTSAAFEMHNILGECRTMDDLEKYRNDFFTIKDDEKQ